MNPSFLSLFKRGKYYRSRYGDGDEDSAEAKAKQEEERKEAERFAVAAIAFCLEHNEEFKK